MRAPARPAPDLAGELLGPRPRSEREATIAVAVYAVSLFVFPSNVVLRVIGGQGFVAGLVALFLFLGWLASSLMGFHDPVAMRHPTRGALVYLALVSLLCWSQTPFHGLSATQQLGADRWILMLVEFAGVVLVAAEGLTSTRALLTVLRAVVWGAAFCSFVAVLQWLVKIDLSVYLRSALPGFSVDNSFDVYQARGALERVYGTTSHPIELGVIAGMLTPLAIVVAQHDRGRPAWRRWAPVLLIGLAVPASVARSAVVALLVSCAVLVLCLPPRPRVTAMVVVPVGVFVVGLARPGYLATLSGLFGAGANDPSISGRLVDVPLVERLVGEHPWLGLGGGTYIADNSIDILDNQFFKSAIELGLLGLTGLLAWFVVPVVTALAARRRTRDPLLASAAAALAGAALAGAVSALTFDGLSFNMYAGLEALVVGCSGACWLLSGRVAPAAPAGTAHPSRGS